MIGAALTALGDLFSPPFRQVLVKSVGLTLILLTIAWLVLQWLIAHVVVLPYPWMDTALALVAGLGVLVGMIFLIPPISTLVAGLFLDDIAQAVENSRYPKERPGRALPAGRSLVLSVRFFGLVLAVNLLAMLLLLVPGVNLVAFLGANAYLLGREYFLLAAMRHVGEAEAEALRRRHRGRVFLAGLLIAGFMMLPLVNILAPLFGTAFMVHVHKGLARRLQPPPRRASLSR